MEAMEEEGRRGNKRGPRGQNKGEREPERERQEPGRCRQVFFQVTRILRPNQEIHPYDVQAEPAVQ